MSPYLYPQFKYVIFHIHSLDCLDVLLPVLTRMLNLLLQTGHFHDDWKLADVHPRLKKPQAELIFSNFRPISNL